MKAIASLAAAALAVSSPQAAWADVGCTGTLQTAYVYSDGSVMLRVSWRNDYTQVCNVKSEWKGITPDVCASWKAMTDAALTLGRTVQVFYTGSVDCATLPTYSAAPAPAYVMLF